MHRRWFVYGDFETIANGPALRIKHPNIDNILFDIDILLFVQPLNGNHPLLNKLLLLHGPIPIDLGHPLRQPLPDPNFAWLKFNALDLLQNLEEKFFAVLGFEVAVDGDVGDLFEGVEGVYAREFGRRGEVQDYADLTGVGWDALLQVELGSCDEVVVF